MTSEPERRSARFEDSWNRALHHPLSTVISREQLLARRPVLDPPLETPRHRSDPQRRSRRVLVTAAAVIVATTVTWQGRQVVVERFQSAGGPLITTSESITIEWSLKDATILPDGRIALGDNSGLIQLWDPELPAALPHRLTGSTGAVLALEADAENRLFASGAVGANVEVWDLDHLDAGPSVYRGHANVVRALAALPDGRIASGSDDRTIQVWDPDDLTGRPVVYSGHRSLVHSMTTLADGRIASGAQDGSVQVWDPDDLGQAPTVYAGHDNAVTALATLRDGRIVSGSYDTTVRVWDPDDPEGGAVVYSGHDRRIRSLAALADGRVVSGGDDGTIQVWDPDRLETDAVAFDQGVKISIVLPLPDGRLAYAGVTDGQHTMQILELG